LEKVGRVNLVLIVVILRELINKISEALSLDIKVVIAIIIGQRAYWLIVLLLVDISDLSYALHFAFLTLSVPSQLALRLDFEHFYSFF